MGIAQGENGPLLNHLLHFLVAGFLSATFIIPLLNHSDDKIVSGISAIGAISSIIQAVYHLGLVIAQYCNAYTSELELGKVARNLLTSIILSAQLILWAVFIKLGLAEDDQNRTYNIIGVIVAAVMRAFDLLLDYQHDENNVSLGITDKLKKVALDVECATQTFSQAPIFTARIFMVHLLLAGSFVLSIINYLGDNQLKLGDIGGNPPAECMLAALILVGVHLFLYPLAAIIRMIPALNAACIRIMCGQGDDCETLESLNRVPLIRSAVAGSVISLLSYVLGSQLGSANVQILIMNLGLYVAADAIGRNIV